jgi:uncharacterized protein YqeY
MTQVLEENDYGWRADSGLSLHDKIRADLKTAMMQKDHATRDALRLILSEFPKLTVPITLESGKKSFRLKKPEEITDEDVLDLIRNLAKSERTVLEIKKETESHFLKTMERYLPQMASRDQIVSWIEANVDFSAVKAPMQAMGTIMKHFGKLADGNLVKDILKARQK